MLNETISAVTLFITHTARWVACSITDPGKWLTLSSVLSLYLAMQLPNIERWAWGILRFSCFSLREPIHTLLLGWWVLLSLFCFSLIHKHKCIPNASCGPSIITDLIIMICMRKWKIIHIQEAKAWWNVLDKQTNILEHIVHETHGVVLPVPAQPNRFCMSLFAKRNVWSTS